MPDFAKPRQSWSYSKRMIENKVKEHIDLKFLEEDARYPLWLKIGTLLDGVSTRPFYNANLVFDQEDILFCGPSENLPSKAVVKPGQDSPDFELNNYTVMPGLIEAHSHLFLEGGELDFEKRKAHLCKTSDQLLRLAQKRMDKLVALGIMGVRDAGDKDGVGLALSAMNKASKKNSTPYIDSPGAAIHRDGRYGRFMGEPFEDFDSAEECVENRILLGADRIKLIPTGIINLKQGKVTAPPQMAFEEVKSFVDAAKSWNKQTFAHASGADGIESAVQGGVDSLEHGYFITHDQLARMRDRNTAWVPTFAPVQAQIKFAQRIGWDEQVLGNLKRILEGHASSLQKAVEMGVTVIAGSDAGSYGVPHGLGLLQELQIMEDAGMDGLAVINAATGVSNSRLGYYEKIGCLQMGYKARMIFSRHDILKTVGNLMLEKTSFFKGGSFEDRQNCEGL